MPTTTSAALNRHVYLAGRPTAPSALNGYAYLAARPPRRSAPRPSDSASCTHRLPDSACLTSRPSHQIRTIHFTH